MITLIAGILLIIAGLVIGWCAFKIHRLEQEVYNLRTPFQGEQGCADFCAPIFQRYNVCGWMYNKTMKKKKAPLNKLAEATRKAHAQELFQSLLLNKHLVVTPAERKGSRQANKRKAIQESY